MYWLPSHDKVHCGARGEAERLRINAQFEVPTECEEFDRICTVKVLGSALRTIEGEPIEAVRKKVTVA